MTTKHIKANPSLQRLLYFVTLVDERSFTRAAERLRVSQPALSRQITLLEGELGVKLLERLPSGVVATVVGREVLVEARLVLECANRIPQVVRDALQLEMGRLAIATYPMLATGILLPAIEVWHERYPNLTIQLSECRSPLALRDAVQSGAADIAIGDPPEGWPGPVKFIHSTEFVLVLPPKDPLLKQRKPISLLKLSHRQWVLYDKTYGISRIIDAVFDREGFRPFAAVETSQVEAAAKLAAAGLGPALVPATNLPSNLRHLGRSASPAITREYHAFARHRWSASARAFLNIIAENG